MGQRNRIEQRTVRVWPFPAGTGTEPWHDHFKVVVEVRREGECFNPARRCFEPRQEQPAYYLATCDAPLGEDASRIRQNPGVFAQLRHFGLNLLRHNGQTNIRAALFDNAISLDRLLNYKGIKH